MRLNHLPCAWDMLPVCRRWGAFILGGLLAVAGLGGCKKPYRVGEHVWVEHDAGVYPAFVRELRGGTRLLVHYQGCDETWIREVTLDRVKGRVDSDTAALPQKSACTQGNKGRGEKAIAPNTPFNKGDKVRVRWRESVYSAVVVKVEARDRFRVHYDGYESAWDETVPMNRIVGRR